MSMDPANWSQQPPSVETLSLLLSDRSPELRSVLAERACQQRRRYFGDSVFSYGFVYFSTYCRNDCSFCYFRRENSIPRYRKTPDEVVTVARELLDSGVDLIDLTMGEDPCYVREDFAAVLEIVRRLKEDTGAPLMLSPGLLRPELLRKFAAAGADWYALYQETYDPELFRRLRLNQNYEQRLAAKEQAAAAGMLLEEGLLAGVGETPEQMAEALLAMGRLRPAQVRVMSFVPQAGSPMEHCLSPGRDLELTVISLLRLLYPQALIPASLDVDGISGLADRIRAGANVVTSIIPPSSGLMGVAHSTAGVDDGGRTLAEVRQVLGLLGLQTASMEEYQACLDQFKRQRRSA